MKLINLTVLSALIVCAGCYSANKKEDNQQGQKHKKFVAGALCPSRADEDKWRKQTVDQMRESRKIPSVDFEFDSFVLETSAYPVLDKLAEILVQNRRYKVIVSGHTDMVGTDEYNDWLSNARANAIKSYLISRSVYPESVKTYGHGKRVPLTLDDSPEGRACNRRVEFVLTTRAWNAIY